MGRLTLAPFTLLLVMALSCSKRNREPVPGGSSTLQTEVTIAFVGDSGRRIFGSPCTKKGGLAPLVGYLQRSSGIPLVLLGSGNLTRAHEPETVTPLMRREAGLFLTTLAKDDRVIWFPGEGAYRFGLKWCREHFPRIFSGAGTESTGRLYLHGSGVLVAGYTYSAEVPMARYRAFHHRALARARSAGARLMVAMVSGPLVFAQSVAQFPGAPAIIFVSGEGGNANLHMTHRGRVILGSGGKLEELLVVHVTFAESVESPLSLRGQDPRHNDGEERLRTAIANARGPQRKALERRLTLYKKARARKKSLALQAGGGTPTSGRGTYEVVRTSLLSLKGARSVELSLEGHSTESCPLDPPKE